MILGTNLSFTLIVLFSMIHDTLYMNIVRVITGDDNVDRFPPGIQSPLEGRRSRDSSFESMLVWRR